MLPTPADGVTTSLEKLSVMSSSGKLLATAMRIRIASVAVMFLLLGTTAPRSRGLIPCRWIEWLPMGIDGRLQVLGEVGIGHRRVAQFLLVCLRECDALADLPPGALRRSDDGYGTMVLLHDHLDAFLDLGQHGVDIAGEFSFCDASSLDAADMSGCATKELACE